MVDFVQLKCKIGIGDSEDDLIYPYMPWLTFIEDTDYTLFEIKDLYADTGVIGRIRVTPYDTVTYLVAQNIGSSAVHIAYTDYNDDVAYCVLEAGEFAILPGPKESAAHYMRITTTKFDSILRVCLIGKRL